MYPPLALSFRSAPNKETTSQVPLYRRFENPWPFQDSIRLHSRKPAAVPLRSFGGLRLGLLAISSFLWVSGKLSPPRFGLPLVENYPERASSYTLALLARLVLVLRLDPSRSALRRPLRIRSSPAPLQLREAPLPVEFSNLARAVRISIRFRFSGRSLLGALTAFFFIIWGFGRFVEPQFPARKHTVAQFSGRAFG